MKKIFTLLCGIALTASAANAEPQQWLLSQNSTVGFEKWAYGYNERNLVDNVEYTNQDYINYSYWSKYTYDDAGNLTRVAEWQNVLESDVVADYLPVNYIDYKYNTLGQRIERINYNNTGAKDHPDSPKWLLGAVWTYEYGMDGKITREVIYWDLAKTNLFQQMDYVYNAKGQVEQIKISVADFGGKLTHNANVNYFYNEDGQIIEKQQCEYDETANIEKIVYCILYEYDADGTLVKQEKTTASKKTVAQRFIYTYFDDYSVPVADIVYPMDPEEDRLYNLFSDLKRVPYKYEEWETDQNTGNLVLYDTFVFNYENIRPTSVEKVESAAQPAGSAMSIATVSKNDLQLRGLKALDNVRVYDLNGRCVLNTTYGHGVNISELPAGSYVVATDNGAAKFVK